MNERDLMYLPLPEPADQQQADYAEREQETEDVLRRILQCGARDRDVRQLCSELHIKYERIARHHA